MKTFRFFAALLIAFSLLGIRFSTTLAVPPMPSSFYGTVLVNGVNVQENFPISAWINGVQYAVNYTVLYGGESVYSISVPGDDLSTTGIIEGGTHGQTIVFKIDQLSALQTGTWQSGLNLELNLTAVGYRIFLPLIGR